MAGYAGRQGRRPKASTIVERNRKKRRAPSTTRGIPHAPDHLSETERAEWRRVARQLKAVGLLDALDKTALAAYCVSYGTWIEAQAKVREEGMVITTPNGFPMQSPYVSIANKAMADMLAVLREFGMTPASRSRLPKQSADERRPRRATKPHQLDPRELLEHAN